MEKIKNFFTHESRRFNLLPVTCVFALLTFLCFISPKTVDGALWVIIYVCGAMVFCGICEIIRISRNNGLGYFTAQYENIVYGNPKMFTNVGKRRIAFRFTLRNIFQKRFHLSANSTDTVTFILQSTSYIDDAYATYKQEIGEKDRLDFEDFKMIYGSALYICASNHRNSDGFCKFAIVALYDCGEFTNVYPRKYYNETASNLHAILHERIL